MSTSNVKILLRRGKRKDISAGTLETGEMGFATDTNQLYVGIDPAINEVQFDPFANAKSIVQSWLNSEDNPYPGLVIDEDLVIRNIPDDIDPNTGQAILGSGVNNLMEAMNFFVQTITFDTTSQTFTPGDNLNQEHFVDKLDENNNPVLDANGNPEKEFKVRTIGEIVTAPVLNGQTVVTLKIHETQPDLRKEEDFSVVVLNQNTTNDALSSITVTDAKLKDKFHEPISIEYINQNDPNATTTTLTLANGDYNYSFNEATKEGTINFTPALTDFQNSTEQVTSTEVLGTTDGINGTEVQFNLNGYPALAPTSLEVTDAGGNVIPDTDYEIIDSNHVDFDTVTQIRFTTAPTGDMTISYKSMVDGDENDVIESITVNFSDDANFNFEILSTTGVNTDLSSLTHSNITGGSEFPVSQYAVPRTNVEVATENTFNQMFADQHLKIYDVNDGRRSSLFRKSLVGQSNNFLNYEKNECTTFFVDYSLKQTNATQTETFVRVGTLKVINGVPQGINKIKLTDDNTEIWQDDGDNIAQADEFSNIEFKSKIEDVIRVNSTTIADVKEWFAPSDITETFTAAANDTVFTIAQTLDVNGYEIDSVLVDGTSYVQTTDWTLSGQDITFINPTMAGGEVIEVKLKYSVTSPNKPYILAYQAGAFMIDNEAGATGNVIVRFRQPTWTHTAIPSITITTGIDGVEAVAEQITNDASVSLTANSIQGNNILIYFEQDNNYESEISFTVKRWTM